MNNAYDWGTPYDPDMTVHEALAAGLIAIIDTGTIATGNYEPCGYEGPFKPQNTAAADPSRIRCTRSKGHHGTHAYVTRWEMSQRDHEKIMREQKQQRAAAEERKRERERQTREEHERLQKAARRMAQELGVMGTEIAKQMEPVAKAMIQMDRDLNRVAAQAYSPMEGHKKNARFRDRSAGKVRGR